MYSLKKQELIDYGNKLIDGNYTLGTGGNLSTFIRSEKIMLITPSGIPFNQIKLTDIVTLKLDGTIVDGTRLPSSEWRMHAIMYENREDLNYVIHGHTIYSTAIALLRQPLPASHYMIATAGMDVRCADYASFGTEKLATNAYNAMKNRKAVLLANHGILTGGKTIIEAFSVLEEVEYCAKVHIIASSIGTPTIMSETEMKNMENRFESYGQK